MAVKSNLTFQRPLLWSQVLCCSCTGVRITRNVVSCRKALHDTSMTFRSLLSHLLAFIFVPLALAQQTPSGGIQDNTHALADASRALLAAELVAFRQDMGYPIWLSAESFLNSGQSLQNQARDLRRSWSGTAEAALMAYDRSTDTIAISLTPSLWQRHSTAGLVQMMQSCGTLIADRGKPADQRLTAAMLALTKGLRDLEKQQLKVADAFSRDHRRLATAFCMILAAGAMLLAFLGIRVRRRDVHSEQQSFIPQIQINHRLGAPYGGGATAIWDAQAGTHAS